MKNPLDLKTCPALTPGVRLQVDPVSGESVLLYPEGVLVLNETAQAIVEYCDGKTSVDDILATLSAEYEVDETTLADDARECLGDLASRNLVVFRP